MADSFEPSRLSTMSKVLLAALVLVNAAVFLYPGAGPKSGAGGRPGIETMPGGRTLGQTAGDTLLMIDELNDAEREERRTARAEPVRPMPEASPDVSGKWLSCRVWGLFTGEGPLQGAREALLRVSDRVEEVVSRIEAAPDYLVYLGTDDNPDNARRLMQELESQGIDAYVIAGGPFLNEVSAGVFSNRSRAELLVKKLDDLGYDPQLEALKRTQEVRHLIARVPEEFELEGFSSVPCQEFAPGREFL